MKKFIITGIQMRNKGSQAMFLSLYYALKSYDANCEVVGFAFKTDEPEQYAFKLLPHDDYTRLVFKYRLNRASFVTFFLTRLAALVRKTDKWNGKLAEMNKALQEADAIFDASGYTLGSGWSKGGGERLLETIKMARRNATKIVLMPQSFGPFNWGEDNDAQYLERVKEELRYCSKIYARETEGYECLRALGLENVELSADMVIREEFFPKSSDIFENGSGDPIDYPEEGSVGFIVNENLFRIGEPDKVRSLYARILDRLVDRGETVYFLNTSTADLALTELILSEARNSSQVRVITGDYSSPDLIEMIGRFKYTVASRYHSIVFGYRSGVPAIIFGWAAKYNDLAAHFGQQDFVFDVKNADFDRIVEKIEVMGRTHAEESQKIRENLAKMHSSSVVEDALDALNS
ncbi:polysaccharide pyruvyl transferase family protein [Erythrobacter sp.]|jgi:polysaccharide pyruvyl transferase WcaK-like protein|uniref:polysaccharide pyruvyl transferase family protein n=1 Tax=Erythrobacter sp. TaxID=1042 RepID=UPI002EAB9C54|nr:polysaccharide pyruvyl transferase family protein [Erythrobacter sp.]